MEECGSEACRFTPASSNTVWFVAQMTVDRQLRLVLVRCSTRIETWQYLDFVMSTQVISNVLPAQLLGLHMTRYNRRISAQERLGNKAVELLVAKPETPW